MVTTPGNSVSTHTLRLRSDASGMTRGLAAVDKELADVARQLDRVQTASGAASAGVAGVGRETNKYRGVTRGARAGAQNFAFQLQDIAIQAEQGVDPLRIFVQQGTQIAGIFGPTISVISAVAAAIALVVSSAQAFKTAAGDMKDETDALNEASEALTSTQELLNAQVVLGSQANTQYLQTLQEVQEAEEERARTALKNATGIQDYVTNILTAQSIAAQTGVQGPEVDLFGLDTINELIFLQTRLNELIDAENDERTKVFTRIQEEIELRGLYNEETRQLLIDLARQLQFSEQITEENEDALEALEASTETIAGITEAFEQLDEDAESVADWLKDYKKSLEEADKAASDLAETFIEEVSTAVDSVGAKLQTFGVNLLGVWETAKRVAREVQAEQLDAFGGEGPDVVEPWGGWDNTPETTRGGRRGRKTQAEKDAEALAKLNEEFDKAVKNALDYTMVMEDAFSEVGTSAIDNFIDGLVKGELAFKDFARSILQDLAKILLRSILVNALLSAVGIGPGMKTENLTGLQRIVAQIAGMNITPNYKGNVISSPGAFPMSGGIGTIAERGPEAIMPLERDSNGNLGVSGPAITVNNYTGAEVSVDRSQDMITIAVGQARQAVAADFSRSMALGQGTYARAMEGSYTSRRKAT